MSFVGGGFQNTSSACYSVVTGGKSNTASGAYSSVLGGKSNTTAGFADVMVVGSNLTANRACTTFVNNLSIMNIPTSSAGLPAGAVWRSGNVLNIV
jgi:hypothetical protein